MKEFDNYIFDLYGTLVDIRTDEGGQSLWDKGARRLNEEFGTKWTGKSLREMYLKLAREEEKKLSAENGADFPEILIENLWLRLIKEGVDRKSAATNGKKADDTNPSDEIVSESSEELSVTSPEILSFCTWFRETSRVKFRLFEGVIETLDKLRSSGKKVYLLSNAQRAYTAKELSDLGLSDKFDDIFISSDKQIKKPQKEFMELLVSKHGLSVDKCVMIGNDIFSDVGVAVRNGMNSIFLNTDGHSDKKISDDIRKLGIKGSCLMPAIIEDGDIRKIF